jgi:hypothetical protein
MGSPWPERPAAESGKIGRYQPELATARHLSAHPLNDFARNLSAFRLTSPYASDSVKLRFRRCFICGLGVTNSAGTEPGRRFPHPLPRLIAARFNNVFDRTAR